MAKPLKLLADQLRKNDGVTLVTTFDDSISLGSVVDAPRWNNITFVGNAAGSLTGDFPAGMGPQPCMLPNMNRHHELDLDAGFSLMGIKVPLKIGGSLKRVSDVVFKFDSPLTWTLDSLQLEGLIESQPAGFWDSPLGQALSDKDTRIVTQVFRSKFSFVFRGEDGNAINVQTDIPANALQANVGLKLGWRQEFSLESQNEILVGVKLATYDRKKGRLIF